jgi:hypothetical protein
MEHTPHPENSLAGMLFVTGSWMLTFFSFLASIDLAKVAGLMSCIVSLLAIWYYVLQIKKLKRDAK